MNQICLITYSIGIIITCEAKGQNNESQPLVGQESYIKATTRENLS